jgi:enoyl-CoA hydratase/carnithine racemase
MQTTYGDVGVSLNDHVAVVEIQRPPHNFFDHMLIKDLADAFDDLDENPDCRALVLASDGKSFCAGANFQGQSSRAQDGQQSDPNALYREATRMFSNKKPVIGAIQGAAIGGGLGVAMVPDFRIACPEARFAANFVKLGFHPGFGLTHTLPKLIGQQKANLIFYTGRRIDGETALEWGLADMLVSQDALRQTAIDLAKEIAENAPLAVMATRATMREGLAEAVSKQTDHELAEQNRLRQTEDFKEGVRAVAERRPGNFQGR